MTRLLLLAALLASGCATTASNPCSMASMNVAELESALVNGCRA